MTQGVSAMTGTSVYKDIAKRTGGDIFIGVVGPVRTGKSTFIRRFMESVILPSMEDKNAATVARDELPQSAGGRTVMTAEPKFVPDRSVEVMIDGKVRMRARMVDCVGYLIPDALGRDEEGVPRMVNTPWSDEPMPFEAAAEMGTRKVIAEHSTVGMLVTTDGTVGDIPRESYVEAEERVVRELRALGKPFAVILNSAAPESEAAVTLAMSLEEKYGAPVALVNCLELDSEDIHGILEMLLGEFPVTEICVNFPGYIATLEDDHRYRRHIEECLRSSVSGKMKLREAVTTFPESFSNAVCGGDEWNGSTAEGISADMGSGRVSLTLVPPKGLYYALMGEMTGLQVTSERELVMAIRSLSETKKEYDRIAAAVDQVNDTGYGIVMPLKEELVLEEPEITREGGGFGVRIRASAPSIHMIRTNIETELNPTIGTEEQSREMMEFMRSEMKEDPERVWSINMFGRSLYDMVNDGMRSKLDHMPPEAREKMGETLTRIICEGANGLLCIIL